MRVVGLKAGRCRGRKFRVCVLLLFVAHVRATRADAAPSPSDQAIERGLALRRSAHDAEALDEFKKAYELSPSPRALTQMAWAEQALGRWTDAEIHLKEALKSNAEPWIRKVRPKIEDSLAAVGAHLGNLEVTGTPAGADVDIDGKKAGTLPLREPVRVPAGDVVLEVRSANYRPISRTVNIRARELARETVTLVAVNSPGMSPAALAATGLAAPTPRMEAEATPLPVADPASTVPSQPAGNVPPVSQQPDREGTWRGPAKWIAAGAAVLMLGAGVTGLVVHGQKVSAFDDKTDPVTMSKRCSNASGGVTGGDDCVSLAHDADHWRNIAIVGFVGAGVLAAGALVLQLTDDRPPAGTASNGRSMAAQRGAALSCDVNPLVWGAACRVRF